MDKFTILLVEDDLSTCNRFIEYIDTLDDIVLVNHTNNATQAISYIEYYHPDAVILDLELHCGGGSGIDVLSNLNPATPKPYILVTTNNSSNTTYECARHFGADYIISKHQAGYSEKYVTDFLISIKNIIIQHKSNNDVPLLDTPEHSNRRIRAYISKELNTIGINPKAVGYQYLLDAISIIMDGPTNNLCTQIAKLHKKSEPSVERAMQNAINRAWNTGDTEHLFKNYTGKISSDKGSPTVTEFIYYYANKIKNTIN